jgi:hypothetical protein
MSEDKVALVSTRGSGSHGLNPVNVDIPHPEKEGFSITGNFAKGNKLRAGQKKGITQISLKLLKQLCDEAVERGDGSHPLEVMFGFLRLPEVPAEVKDDPKLLMLWYETHRDDRKLQLLAAKYLLPYCLPALSALTITDARSEAEEVAPEDMAAKKAAITAEVLKLLEAQKND